MTFREFRERKGYRTQAQLALASGCQQTTISQIELGKIHDPRWSTLRGLSTALGVSVATIARLITHATKSKPARVTKARAA
jgi:transcriptional regulator with XRE-family HTH domain